MQSPVTVPQSQPLTNKTDESAHKPSILLVEDQDARARVVEIVLEELGKPVQLYRAATVDQALHLLSMKGLYESVPEPAQVLLDLNLPGKHGYELLAAILADEALRHIRVVIFSSADHAADRANSLSRGAFAHIGKPWTYTAYEKAIRDILQMIPNIGSTPTENHRGMA